MAKYTVNLKKLAEEVNLKAVHLSSTYEKEELCVADVNRPALQLTGFYDYFDPRRVQIIGRVETKYIQTLSSDARKTAFAKLFSYKIAALVICHGCEPMPECIEMAEKYDINVFITSENTSTFEANILYVLHREMAPRITRHGVLVEVYGEGLFITGDSGIGKSETALELIKRGHRLIADDAVEIKLIDNELIGSAPDMIRYYMELRGIGVVNIRHLYGVGSVMPSTNIDLVVALEKWDDTKAYDRLGLTNETEDILTVTLPKVTIPVRPGRNLAIIMELAAMNNRQKKMGYNAAEMLAAEVDAAVDAGMMY